MGNLGHLKKEKEKKIRCSKILAIKLEDIQGWIQNFGKGGRGWGPGNC